MRGARSDPDATGRVPLRHLTRCSRPRHRILIAALALAALTLSLPTARAADTTHVAAPPGPPNGVRYLYLIRHGMYDRDSTDAD